MKKLLVLLLTILISASILSTGFSKTKKAQKNPCFKKCAAEYNVCMKDAKKAPKAERAAKRAACKQALKDCKAACKSEKAPEASGK